MVAGDVIHFPGDDGTIPHFTLCHTGEAAPKVSGSSDEEASIDEVDASAAGHIDDVGSCELCRIMQ